MPKLGMREIRRAQLIDATLLTIDQAGLAGTTLASVAQRASISTGIVSHYFGDKDGLLEATMRHVLRDLWNATSRRRRAAKPDPRSKLARGGRGQLRCGAGQQSRDEDVARVLVGEHAQAAIAAACST